MSKGFAVLCLGALSGSIGCLVFGVGWSGVAIIGFGLFVAAVVEDATASVPPPRHGRRGGRR